jgi:hypothetical protein
MACGSGAIGLVAQFTEWRISAKWGFGLMVAFFIIAAVGWLIRPKSKGDSEDLVTDERKLFDQRVLVTGSNQGSISPTYNNNVTIGHKPEVRPVGGYQQQHLPDGRTLTIFVIEVTAPANGIIIQVQGSKLVDLQVSRPERGGVSMTSKSCVSRWGDDRTRTEQFENASGTYEIRVLAETNDLPNIAAKLL